MNTNNFNHLEKLQQALNRRKIISNLERSQRRLVIRLTNDHADHLLAVLKDEYPGKQGILLHGPILHRLCQEAGVPRNAIEHTLATVTYRGRDKKSIKLGRELHIYQHG